MPLFANQSRPSPNVTVHTRVVKVDPAPTPRRRYRRDCPPRRDARSGSRGRRSSCRDAGPSRQRPASRANRHAGARIRVGRTVSSPPSSQASTRARPLTAEPGPQTPAPPPDGQISRMNRTPSVAGPPTQSRGPSGEAESGRARRPGTVTGAILEWRCLGHGLLGASTQYRPRSSRRKVCCNLLDLAAPPSVNSPSGFRGITRCTRPDLGTNLLGYTAGSSSCDATNPGAQLEGPR